MGLGTANQCASIQPATLKFDYDIGSSGQFHKIMQICQLRICNYRPILTFNFHINSEMLLRP